MEENNLKGKNNNKTSIRTKTNNICVCHTQMLQNTRGPPIIMHRNIFMHLCITIGYLKGISQQLQRSITANSVVTLLHKLPLKYGDSEFMDLKVYLLVCV
ncbi:unnamed protein product [Ceratitis capitata]|uniref:(Mediterranean fruit fly) hypothetical protein n=1 Tax=Ceratitis capitata TaxID=7213 RepID=A0A811UT67_CERCA|nr:unnamed protein product [Ceratitis capitata]